MAFNVDFGKRVTDTLRANAGGQYPNVPGQTIQPQDSLGYWGTGSFGAVDTGGSSYITTTTTAGTTSITEPVWVTWTPPTTTVWVTEPGPASGNLVQADLQHIFDRLCGHEERGPQPVDAPDNDALNERTLADAVRSIEADRKGRNVLHAIGALHDQWRSDGRPHLFLPD